MNNSIELTQIGRYDSGIFDEGAAEITAYDRDNQKLWVINGANSTIDILDLSDPTNPTFVDAIDIADLGGGINSIAIKDGLVTAAIEGESAQDPGSIVFFDTEGNILNQVTVGALPDMVTFTPDGTKVLVANEGEPDEDDPNNNPEGVNEKMRGSREDGGGRGVEEMEEIGETKTLPHHSKDPTSPLQTPHYDPTQSCHYKFRSPDIIDTEYPP